jgi:DNA polymerase-3 subunit epsilon
MTQPLVICHSCKKINVQNGSLNNYPLCKVCFEALSSDINHTRKNLLDSIAEINQTNDLNKKLELTHSVIVVTSVLSKNPYFNETVLDEDIQKLRYNALKDYTVYQFAIKDNRKQLNKQEQEKILLKNAKSTNFSSINVDFIVIDFEIANNNLSSACSLGMAFVENNQIVDEKYYLIQPPTMDFDEATTKIHGLTEKDVIFAQKFNELWEEIKFHFDGTQVVAHNAQFDMSVLHSCLHEYSIEMPEFNYICSIPISTRACRGQKVGNSLPDRLAHFNIELKNHHNALADARACAELVITCLKLKKRNSLETYCNTYSSINIHKFSELKPQQLFKGYKKFTSIKVSEIAATVEIFDVNHPLFEQNVVFTGEMQHLERKKAMQKVVDLGGVIKGGVSRNTNFLVVGIQDKSLVGEDGLSTKEEKAYDLINKGINIKIINEIQFMSLID